MQGKDVVVDEDLPNFFHAVKLTQADEFVMEAKNVKRNYGVEIADPRVIRTLDETVMPKKAIQGTPWYNILSNPDYSDAFYYIGAFINERENLIKDGDMDEGNDCEQSDIVMILLNLSCVPDEIAQRFDFKPGFQEDFLQNMKKFQQAF